MPQFEFHISRKSRHRYQFSDSLYSLSGNVIFGDFHAARTFAQKMNEQRDLIHFPEQAVKAGQINAMGLIDELLHYVAREYRMQVNPQALEKALSWLDTRLGKEKVDHALRRFTDEFPPLEVYRGDSAIDEYLWGRTDGLLNRQIALEELLMLWLANTNPAFSPYQELFNDSNLEKHTIYPQLIKELDEFFNTQPTFGPENQTLIQLLRAPALESPHSFSGQLEYIRERWTATLGVYLQRLLKSIDFIKEEEKPIFFGPGPAHVPEYASESFEYPEEERFSADSDWMPRLVLLAKNAYVWLDQLSKEYHRQVKRLDQVPDEELDKLARWGISGLWLIGLWERSPASQRIKQLCGNPDAVSSAYSLYDYVIANDLGGEEAYLNLRSRAWKRGIRLAADMVPNHVGIYSKWVVEHPDWFVSLDHSPFPTYTFDGENLSHDERVGIHLEDHYYSRSDASVVFKRVDQWTGDTQFVYHGNDGTAMPWNDTAQLNFLNPEVREAVIQTILHVARKFPIIRFDAAMTLAKKHFQRLWFPQPGTGGDIPSRAEHGLTRQEFDEAMPMEFWREVVDRVAQEIPDTLLLAEAFWMMEGYFVRTLGMHRVYNSAFMNMLRDEKNAEYRQLIKNTLEFDPQILKRYVNFMNNPDEETAIDQFGSDDKYFGVCSLMATMPGLPMFGHGQVEGYHEKYGMEYHRAYWEEYPDHHLVTRHEREIFPLLHRRSQFAEVNRFLLYDFYTPEGRVDENVFAYSNRTGGEPSLVIYHNRWADVKGWINQSTAFKDKAKDQLLGTNLGDGLGLKNDADTFTIFSDQISGLEYIRSNRDIHENGLYFELGAYKYHVFLDFREVDDNEWGQYAQLNDYLKGRGVPDMDEAMKEILLQPLHYAFRELVNPGMFEWLLENRFHVNTFKRSHVTTIRDEVEQKILRLLAEITGMIEVEIDEKVLVEEVCEKLESALGLVQIPKHLPVSKTVDLDSVLAWLDPSDDDTAFWGVIFGWLFTHNLGKVIEDDEFAERGRSWLDDWLLAKLIHQTLIGLGVETDPADEAVAGVKIMLTQQNWAGSLTSKPDQAAQILHSWLRDDDIRRFLRINRYQGVLWFNKEACDQFLRWMLAIAMISTVADPELNGTQKVHKIKTQFDVISRIEGAVNESGYQVENLLEAI